MVTILTDSTCDLGPELIAERQIQVIPLYVYLNGQTYADGRQITTADLFRSVQETGQLPKTSAPTVADFQSAFQAAGECVYISLSSQLSATYQNARMAQESQPAGQCYVIDSHNLSSGIGLLVLKAADLRDQGKSAKEIADEISALLPNVRTSFTIETLEYLYKGGRCTAMQNLMGSLLHIRPVIAVRSDGTLGVKGRTRGTRKRALEFMLQDFSDHLPEINPNRVFITHTGCLKDAQYLREQLGTLADIQQIYITDAGSVIASHCGPDTIGILYMVN